jgi:hypothetical protein
MVVASEYEPFALTLAYTAGRPAYLWVPENARYSSVTRSPSGQPPALPYTRTLCPAVTVPGFRWIAGLAAVENVRSPPRPEPDAVCVTTRKWYVVPGFRSLTSTATGTSTELAAADTVGVV